MLKKTQVTLNSVRLLSQHNLTIWILVADCFTVEIKQIKWTDVVTFLFLFTLLPKQSNRQGGARAVDLPARSFDLARPGLAASLHR